MKKKLEPVWQKVLHKCHYHLVTPNMKQLDNHILKVLTNVKSPRGIRPARWTYSTERY